MPTPAFPGAEGFGAVSIGGRGGAVLHVTNLNDSGAGSLRAALSTTGPRIIVFDVAGTINHTSPIHLTEPYVTIAGQSAPGEGITLSGEEVRIQAHDVIMRYLRIRTGDVENPDDGWDNRDALNFGQPSDVSPGPSQTYNIILDHLSMSWSVDECCTVWYGAHDITIQNCLISEPLAYSFHPKTQPPPPEGIGDGSWHSMSNLYGSSTVGAPCYNISTHHNVMISGNQRNPQFAYCDMIDFRNNLIYNWGGNTGDPLTQGAAMEIEHPGLKRLNIVNNYYLPGPNSIGPGITPLHTWIRVANDVGTLTDPGAQIYIAGNIGPIAETLITDPLFNNWLFLRSDGNDQIPELYGAHQYRMFVPHTVAAVRTQAAATLLTCLPKRCGATWPYRDEVDERVLQTLFSNNGHIINSPSEVGGWATMQTGTNPIDTDSDGMPDGWELSHGLNPLSSADAATDRDGDGYTNIEEYLNSLPK